MKMTVFILSAGLGKRLRPITNYIPKPLLPILGKPILGHIIEKVSKINPEKIIINLHYKRDLIEEWLDSIPHKNILKIPEDRILGTGGALKNAESFLKSNTFIVYNSDVLSEIDLERFIDYHITSKNLATLAIHDNYQFNKLEIDSKGLLKGIQETTNNNLRAFTGVAIYEPDILELLPDGNSNIVDTWIKAINKGIKIGTYDVTGTYWADIGTPVSYIKSAITQLKRNGESIYIHSSIDWCHDIEFRGYIIIENNAKKTSKGKLKLENCLILPESYLINTSYKNCITFSNKKIYINEKELTGIKESKKYILIGSGGSDRKYYRINNKGQTLILMQSHKNDPDFQRQIEYTSFFRKYNIPVPNLIKVDSKNMRAYFEDLGDTTLYSWLKCQRNQNEIFNIYRNIIDILVLIHTTLTDHVNECPILKSRVFDYEHFRWESNYFLERFVKDIMKINTKEFPNLDEELHRLSLIADSLPKTIIHRDFQSQNIMIKHRNTPYIIDYQGAMMGPPLYDIASLLWDPYHNLNNDIRDDLLSYYQSEIEKNISKKSYAKISTESLAICRLQRHMQALGAYGFLSIIKGKRYFMKYINSGIDLLKDDIIIFKEDLPELYSLINKIHKLNL